MQREKSTGSFPPVSAILVAGLLTACGGSTGSNSVSISPDPIELFVTQSRQLELLDGNGQVVFDATAVWSSTNPTVASVSATGGVNALREGQTFIVVVTQNDTDSATAQVTSLLNGQWSGVFGVFPTPPGGSITFTLNESGGTVTGSGTSGTPNNQVGIGITGTHSFPNLSLTFSSGGMSYVLSGFSPETGRLSISGTDAQLTANKN